MKYAFIKFLTDNFPAYKLLVREIYGRKTLRGLYSCKEKIEEIWELEETKQLVKKVERELNVRIFKETPETETNLRQSIDETDAGNRSNNKGMSEDIRGHQDRKRSNFGNEFPGSYYTYELSETDIKSIEAWAKGDFESEEQYAEGLEKVARIDRAIGESEKGFSDAIRALDEYERISKERDERAQRFYEEINNIARGGKEERPNTSRVIKRLISGS